MDSFIQQYFLVDFLCSPPGVERDPVARDTSQVVDEGHGHSRRWCSGPANSAAPSRADQLVGAGVKHARKKELTANPPITPWSQRLLNAWPIHPVKCHW
jgi:hypothetical protein